MTKDQLALKNCAGVPVRVFFPDQWDGGDTSAAKDICAGCVVKGPCLEDALSRREDGIWGGTSERERRSMRRVRRAS